LPGKSPPTTTLRCPNGGSRIGTREVRGEKEEEKEKLREERGSSRGAMAIGEGRRERLGFQWFRRFRSKREARVSGRTSKSEL